MKATGNMSSSSLAAISGDDILQAECLLAADKWSSDYGALESSIRSTLHPLDTLLLSGTTTHRQLPDSEVCHLQVFFSIRPVSFFISCVRCYYISNVYIFSYKSFTAQFIFHLQMKVQKWKVISLTGIFVCLQMFSVQQELLTCQLEFHFSCQMFIVCKIIIISIQWMVSSCQSSKKCMIV